MCELKSILSILRTSLPFLIGLTAGLYFFVFNIIGFSFSHFPGDLGDARFNNYILEHGYRFLTGEVDSYWNAPFMYPEQDVITYSDNLLGTVPFYSIFRIIGLDRETSFQYWFLLMFIFNYAACYFLLKYLFKNSYAAVIGALVFSASIALQSQIGHAQTIPRFAWPLGIWMGLLFLKELHPKYFFWMLFFLVYQFYCGIYLGFLMFVPATLFLLISLIIKWKMFIPRIKNLKWWGYMLVGLVLNLLLLLPVLIPYKERADQMTLHEYKDIVQSVPTFISFFYSNSGSLFWGSLEHIADDYTCFWDFKIFPGGIATISFFIFIFLFFFRTYVLKKHFDSGIQVLIWTCLITFLFFIRVEDVSMYKLLFELPGFASMRALQRIINIELLFYSIAVAFVLSLILNSKTIYFSFLGFIFFLVFVSLDNKVNPDSIHRREKSLSYDRVNPLIEKMSFIPKGSIVSYEPDTMPSPCHEYQIDAMLASQSLGLKCLNGYSARSPLNFNFYWVDPNEKTRMIWLDQKQVPYNIVHVVH